MAMDEVGDGDKKSRIEFIVVTHPWTYGHPFRTGKTTLNLITRGSVMNSEGTKPYPGFPAPT
jgi:hypothetical protein